MDVAGSARRGFKIRLPVLRKPMARGELRMRAMAGALAPIARVTRLMSGRPMPAALFAVRFGVARAVPGFPIRPAGSIAILGFGARPALFGAGPGMGRESEQHPKDNQTADPMRLFHGLPPLSLLWFSPFGLA